MGAELFPPGFSGVGQKEAREGRGNKRKIRVQRKNPRHSITRSARFRKRPLQGRGETADGFPDLGFVHAGVAEDDAGARVFT